MTLLNDQYKSYLIHMTIGHLFQKEMDVFSLLLNRYLKATHPKFSSRKSINEEIENMYGLKITFYNTTEGNHLVHHLRCKMINPKLVHDDHLLYQVLTFIEAMLFQATFDDASRFEEEKRRVIEQLQAIKDDKQTYATYLYETSIQKYYVDAYSLEEKIQKIDSTSLEDIQHYYHDTFLKGDTLVFATGSFFENEKVMIKRVLGKYEKGAIKPTYPLLHVNQMEDIEVHLPIHQAILHFGFQTDIGYHDPYKTALQLFNEMLGGHANSQLFTVIREEKGLCYSIYSYLNSHHGILSIATGVDEARIKDAQESIHDVIASFQKDMISDALLEQTKAYLIHQITTNLDKQSIYIERALRNHLYSETYDLNARMTSIKNVTKEDIMYVANKLKPAIIHRVRGVQS